MLFSLFFCPFAFVSFSLVLFFILFSYPSLLFSCLFFFFINFILFFSLLLFPLVCFMLLFYVVFPAFLHFCGRVPPFSPPKYLFLPLYHLLHQSVSLLFRFPFPPHSFRLPLLPSFFFLLLFLPHSCSSTQLSLSFFVLGCNGPTFSSLQLFFTILLSISSNLTNYPPSFSSFFLVCSYLKLLYIPFLAILFFPFAFRMSYVLAPFPFQI